MPASRQRFARLLSVRMPEVALLAAVGLGIVAAGLFSDAAPVSLAAIEGARLAAAVWVVTAAGLAAGAVVIPVERFPRAAKIWGDFWIPFVGGLAAADLYTYSITGRRAWFYIEIVRDLGAHRWVGSGGMLQHWALFIPAAVCVALTCLIIRIGVSWLRPRQILGTGTFITAVAASVILVIAPLASSPGVARAVPDGWQRSLPPMAPGGVSADGRPDVLVLVAESLRPDAVTRSTMPFISRVMADGIRLNQHHSGANSSLPGLFALLDAAPATGVKEALAEARPLRTLERFDDLGYETLLVCGGDPGGYEAMDRLMSPRYFDRCLMRKHADWWQGDAWALSQAAKLVSEKDSDRQPRLVIAFLSSTHFAYELPERVGPDGLTGGAISDDDSRAHDAELLIPWIPGSPERTEVKNRYRACVGALDEMLEASLADVVESDAIVAITGDHGQALYDDGTIAHWSRLSDAQTRVPFLVRGGGATARQVAFATTHADAAALVVSMAEGRPTLPSAAPVLLVQTHPGHDAEDWVLLDGSQRTAWRQQRGVTWFVGTMDRWGRLRLPGG